MAMSSKDKRRRRRSLVRRDGLVCQICWAPRDLATLTIDHIEPRCEGGPNALGNLRLACYSCNYGRHHWPADASEPDTMTGASALVMVSSSGSRKWRGGHGVRTGRRRAARGGPPRLGQNWINGEMRLSRGA
jgi:hypothetical protein